MSVQVYLFHPKLVPEDLISSVLRAEEISRAASFVFEKDGNHWSACRAAMRAILGRELNLMPKAVPIEFLSTGKPVLASPYEDCFFNLSHCEDLAILALSKHSPVGVDVEMRSRGVDLLECVDVFCHPQEIERLPAEMDTRADELLQIWTAKEAVLKSLGIGLFQAPDALAIHFSKGVATANCDISLVGLDLQRIRPISHPMLSNHRAMLSTIGLPNLEIIPVLDFIAAPPAG